MGRTLSLDIAMRLRRDCSRVRIFSNIFLTTQKFEL